MQYTLIRQKRKSMAVSVDRTGKVIVKAPYGMPEVFVDGFVSRHRNWIDRRVREEADKASRAKPLSEEEIKAMKEKAGRVMTRKTEKFARIMNVTYSYIHITSAKRRWGSCNSKGGICYSYRVMLLDDERQDYIAVHELSHRRHMNHSPLFYAEVAKVLPNYRQIEKRIKRFEGLDLY